jgi:putative redox protein
MAEISIVKTDLTWVAGMQFVAHAAGSNVAIVLDGGLENGVGGTGVRPMEALLLSLAGCTGMDVISILRKKQQRVTAFRVNVNGERAPEPPQRYTRIHLEYVVRGWDVAEAAVVRSIELSQTKYCSVSASLNAEIDYTYRVEQETAAS